MAICVLFCYSLLLTLLVNNHHTHDTSLLLQPLAGELVVNMIKSYRIHDSQLICYTGFGLFSIEKGNAEDFKAAMQRNEILKIKFQICE